MGVDFNWRESWSSSESQTESKNKPRRWWSPPAGVFIAVGMLVVFGLGAGLWWLVQANSTLGRARGEVQAAWRAEASAVAHNNLDGYLALQDPEDKNWLSYQRLHFPERVQTVGGQIETARVVDLGQSNGRRWAEFEIARQGVPYQEVQFYRQRGPNWYHAASDPEYWLHGRSVQISFVRVTYSEREENWITPVITALDKATSQIAGTLNLSETQQSQVNFDFVHTEILPPTASAGQLFVLASPLFQGVRADGQPDAVLLNTLADDVAAVLVSQRAGAPFTASRNGPNWSVYHAAAGWLVEQALPDGPGARERQKALAQAIGQGVQFSLRKVSAGPQSNLVGPATADSADIQALALVEYIGYKYGADGLRQFLRAFTPAATLTTALQEGLQIGPTAFEISWQTWLKNR